MATTRIISMHVNQGNASISTAAWQAFCSIVIKKSGMGKSRCERFDFGVPIISTVRLPVLFSNLAVLCTVLLTVIVFFSQSISDHLSAHTSPKRIPVYRLSKVGKSSWISDALRSFSCSEQLKTRCSLASWG